MIRKLPTDVYRRYSGEKDAKTRNWRNLDTSGTCAAAARHEREVQYFKHHG